MSQRQPPYAGRFVWHDLMSNDVGRSEEFYAQFLGWEVREVDLSGAGPYRMFSSGGVDLGGFVPLDPEADLPTHWVCYVTVDDVDAAMERAAERGGKAAVAPRDVPGVGRFAVLVDAQGAVISPFRFAGAMPPEPSGDPPPGHFCWYQLNARDLGQAVDFYRHVFGWRTAREEIPERGRMVLFKRGGSEVASSMEMPPGTGAPAHWLPYVYVSDADTATARARELGAEIYVPPTDIAYTGRFSVLADPTGGMVALFGPATA